PFATSDDRNSKAALSSLHAGIGMNRNQTIRPRFASRANYGVDYVLDLGVRHTRENRQRETGTVLALGDRKITGTIPKGFLVKGLQMERYEMHAARDALARQGLHELVAIGTQAIQSKAKDVQVPGSFPIVGNPGIDEFLASRKSFQVAGSNGLALLLHGIAF